MHRGGFRPDVEGLRAVAIVAVLLCHAGIPWLAGGYVGVDVFFVISGFLITQLLLEEVERTGTISISRFYASRARRILPLSALLLAAVALLSLALLSPLRDKEVSGDVVGSALYVVNWHFAAQSVDYFAKGLEPSPVLHLWSLSVEEQFYFLWPTLLLAVAWLGRRLLGAVRPLIWAAVALVFLGSLALSVEQTAAQPAYAYFSTFDRAWELALGGLLALVGAIRPPRWLAAGIGWVGLAAIAYAVLFFTAATPFPGIPALVPTLGAGALILAGAGFHERPGASPAALLSLPPVRYVGRISYSWYLWHWPALVFAAALFGTLSPLAGIAVVLASLVPTVVSHHVVEDPVRHWRSLVRLPQKGLALGFSCMGTALLAGFLLVQMQPSWRTLPVDEARGARALAREPQPEQTAKAIRPNPLFASEDLPRAVEEGCLTGYAGTASGTCVYGDPQGGRTLVLFGDSHAMQHFPALQVIARRNRWRLVVLTKRECTPAEVTVRSSVEGGEYSQCDAWRRNALRRIEGNAPAGVLVGTYTRATAFGPGGEQLRGQANTEALEAGYAATLRRLRRAGLDPVVLRDTPEAPEQVPSCVSENMGDLRACGFGDPYRWSRNFDLRAAARTGTPLIDVSPEICPRRLCRAVIGRVIVYHDNAHLTAVFDRTLSRWIEPRLKRALRRSSARGARRREPPIPCGATWVGVCWWSGSSSKAGRSSCCSRRWRCCRSSPWPRPAKTAAPPRLKPRGRSCC